MSKTQIVLATGEVYDVEDKGERRILIPVAQVNGGIENMINWDGKDKDTLALIKYIPFRYTFRSASSNAS